MWAHPNGDGIITEDEGTVVKDACICDSEEKATHYMKVDKDEDGYGTVCGEGVTNGKRDMLFQHWLKWLCQLG